MKRKHAARSPPTTRNIPELGISECIPLTEYFPFRVNDPEGTLDKMNYRVLGKTGLTISEVGRALPVPKSAKGGVVFQPKLPKELANVPGPIIQRGVL